jgi:hypothetical protein
VGLSTASSIFTITNSPITSSGNITINPTNTPTGSGSIVLNDSPTLLTPTITGQLQVNGSWNLLAANSGVTCASQGAVIHTGSYSVSGNLTLSNLTASQSVQTNGSKILVSVANTGTGNNVLSTSPTLTTPTITGVAKFLDPVNVNNSHLFGYDQVSVRNYGFLNFKFVSSNNVLNDFEIGMSSCSITFKADGGWDLAALGPSTACSSSGAVSHLGTYDFVASSTGYDATGCLNIQNSNVNPQGTVTVLAPNMNIGNQHSLIIGRFASGYASGLLSFNQIGTGSINTISLSIYGYSGFSVNGDGNTATPGTSTLGGNVGIRVYKLQATLGAVNSNVTVALPAGVTNSNLISMTAICTNSGGFTVHNDYADTTDGSHFRMYTTPSNNLNLFTGPSSSSIAGRTCKVTFITES